jgi:hypothetical protein
MRQLFKTTFRPGQPSTTNDPKKTIGYVQDVERRVRNALEGSNNFLSLTTLYAEPETRFSGMIVLADGAEWDPGSGAGLYRWIEASSTWLPIGGGGSSRAYAARHG